MFPNLAMFSTVHSLASIRFLIYCIAFRNKTGMPGNNEHWDFGSYSVGFVRKMFEFKSNNKYTTLL